MCGRAAHEDIDALTLLLGAQEAGLELLDRDGRWLAVEAPPGAVVCNVGDMLQRLTNHVLPSTTHRVVNPAPERRGMARYSTPFFLHFRPDFLIRTLPSCVTPQRPDRYPEPIAADAYLPPALGGDRADLTSEHDRQRWIPVLAAVMLFSLEFRSTPNRRRSGQPGSSAGSGAGITDRERP